MEYLAVKSIGKIQIVPIDTIVSLKTASNYVEVNSLKGCFLHREPMKDLLNRLDENKFIRVHRSAAINLDYLVEISSEMGRFNHVILQGEQELPIGSSYKESLFSRLGIHTEFEQRATGTC